MRYHVSVCLFAVALVCPCSGQNVYLDEIYGDGVHSYFRGEVYESQAQFDRAIRHGSRDPRVYYFRAVTRLDSCDQFQAEEDIRTAVTYELQGRGTYDVGRALERIQGPQRLELERIRQLAKLELRGLATPMLPFGQPPRVPSDLPLENASPIPDSPFGIEDDSVDSSDLDLDRLRDDSSEMENESDLPSMDEATDDPFMDDAAPTDATPNEALPPEPSTDATPSDDIPSDDPFGAAGDDPFGVD